MSQVGNTLRMLFLLQCKGKMKIKDLASALELDERSIRRNKDHLEQVGIDIISETGKYGGYRLENENILLGLNLSDQEYTSLLLVEKHLNDSKHICSKEITRIVEKVNVVRKSKREGLDEINHHMNKATLYNIDRETERKKLMDIHAAVLFKNKIRMKYISFRSGITERLVRPYATFQYKGDMYFIGFCELKNEVRDFKLCRISEYEVLDELFTRDEAFDLEKAMKNCLGIYKDKEYDIKLKIKYPISQIVKEKIWVENQVIKDVGDGSIVYKAKMRGLAEIKTWILGMGSQVEVIGPEEIVEEIRGEIEKMKNLYCADGCPG